MKIKITRALVPFILNRMCCKYGVTTFEWGVRGSTTFICFRRTISAAKLYKPLDKPVTKKIKVFTEKRKDEVDCVSSRPGSYLNVTSKYEQCALRNNSKDHLNAPEVEGGQERYAKYT